jgi:hypothetical protein
MALDRADCCFGPSVQVRTWDSIEQWPVAKRGIDSNTIFWLLISPRPSLEVDARVSQISPRSAGKAPEIAGLKWLSAISSATLGAQGNCTAQGAMRPSGVTRLRSRCLSLLLLAPLQFLLLLASPARVVGVDVFDPLAAAAHRRGRQCALEGHYVVSRASTAALGPSCAGTSTRECEPGHYCTYGTRR